METAFFFFAFFFHTSLSLEIVGGRNCIWYVSLRSISGTYSSCVTVTLHFKIYVLEVGGDMGGIWHMAGLISAQIPACSLFSLLVEFLGQHRPGKRQSEKQNAIS